MSARLGSCGRRSSAEPDVTGWRPAQRSAWSSFTAANPTRCGVQVADELRPHMAGRLRRTQSHVPMPRRNCTHATARSRDGSHHPPDSRCALRRVGVSPGNEGHGDPLELLDRFGAWAGLRPCVLCHCFRPRSCPCRVSIPYGNGEAHVALVANGHVRRGTVEDQREERLGLGAGPGIPILHTADRARLDICSTVSPLCAGPRCDAEGHKTRKTRPHCCSRVSGETPMHQKRSRLTPLLRALVSGRLAALQFSGGLVPPPGSDRLHSVTKGCLRDAQCQGSPGRITCIRTPAEPVAPSCLLPVADGANESNTLRPTSRRPISTTPLRPVRRRAPC
jgi:hypothetical protein